MKRISKSQSPLIGAFVPGTMSIPFEGLVRLSQSPLIGAFVPGDIRRHLLNEAKKVSIPSDRGIRSGGRLLGT